MDKKEPYWLKHPRFLIKEATTYLKKRGYADCDPYRLAKAIVDNPEIPNRNELLDLIDNRPKAEIVAIASMLCLAQEAVVYWERGDHEMVAEAMYYLGHKQATAETFCKFRGQPADMGLAVSDFLKIAEMAKELDLKDSKHKKQIAGAGTANRQKDEPLRLERDRKICSKGQIFLKSGTQQCDLIKKILHHFTNKKLWENYPPYRPLTTEYIRIILRKGKVIP